MKCLAFSNGVRLQRVPSAICVEAACITKNIRESIQNSNKKTGRSSRMVILLDMAPLRRSVLEIEIRRVVDWPPLLTWPNRGCHGFWLKHPVKVAESEDDRNQHTSTHGGTYSVIYRHARECKVHKEQKSIFCKCIPQKNVLYC